MQALQYTRIIKKIVVEMKVRELLSFLEPLLARGASSVITEEQKNRFATLAFDSRAGFARLMENAPTAKVLKSLDVGTTYDQARLGRLVTAISTAQNFNILQSNVEFFRFEALLKSLDNLEKSCTELLEKEKLRPADNADEILELQLVDYDGMGIEPIRLERFISVLIRLHTNFARILDDRNDRLRFLYFDSGSDLIIGIQCAKAVLDGIRTLIREYWDRTRFRNFDTFEKKMEAVSKTLTVMETVKHAVDNKVIDEETGALLKTRVLKEVDQLVGLGASLPVYDDTEKVDHRQLLLEKRETKLLTSGEPTDET